MWEGIDMKVKKTSLAIAVGVSLGAVGFASSADASRCGGMPDGEVVLPGPNESWDSPGEVVSYVVRNVGPGAQGAPGQLVSQLCGGAP